MPLEVAVRKRFRGFALDVRFETAQQPLAILGPSGAGKSMLLRCIAGLERPDQGQIILNDRVLFHSEKWINVPARERRVGLVFQHYALFPHRTVAENIAFGLRHLRVDEQRRRVASLVDRVHIAGLEQRSPAQLSGGEQQRVALARALAIEPQALLLDEPLSALDTHLRSRIEQELQETFSTYQRPVLLVTHNIEEAYRLGQSLLVLSQGRVAASGPKAEIFRHPPNVEVAQLTGCKNISHARISDRGLIEALDWGCRLQIPGTIKEPPSFVGIRAHHVDFAETAERSSTNSSSANVFPCWLTESSETPFRMTLYLRLSESSDSASAYQLQVELLKEKWEQLRMHPLPWHVRLSPDHLFLMSK